MTEPATVFGRYELRGTLGRGGFATVYRARDPLLGREVALKTLLPHLSEDSDVRDRFIAESQRIAQLHHPNIITVYDVGEVDGRPYFTMEVIEGYTLNRLMTGGAGAPLARVTEMMAGLCSAVDYLHDHKLVHRDIKPANIMIEDNGRVVLMDFGVARAVNQTQYTQAGMSIGTPTAMAPEQVLGKVAGPPADIYALGILAYQLLSGKPPFSGDTAYVLYAHAHEAPPPLRDVRPGLPDNVYETIEAALAKDPDDRPATAREFADALNGVAPLRRRGEQSGSDTLVFRTPGGQDADSTLVSPAERYDEGALYEPASRSRQTGTLPSADAVSPHTGRVEVNPPPVETGRLGTAGTGRSLPIVPLAIGGVVLVAAIIGGIVVLGQSSKKPSPTPTAARATASAVPTIAVSASAVIPPPATAAPSAVAPSSVATGVATQAPPRTASPTPAPTPPPPLAATYTVVTLAGTGAAGRAGGPAAQAQFNTPTGLAIDGSGNVFVADYGNQVIRRIGADGNVTILAGSGRPGFQNGPAMQAMFSNPSALAADSKGNIYVADLGNYRIRRIAPNGDVSTVAGSGAQGSANGPGASATFVEPLALTVDKDGNIYVADGSSNQIRKIDAAGNVTTFAGNGGKGNLDGPAASALFSKPNAICISPASGTLYVVDHDSNRVRKVTPDGNVTSLAGDGNKGNADGPGRTAEFTNPAGCAVDAAENVYIADLGNNRVRRISPNGVVATLAGAGTAGSANGPGENAQFDGLSDIAVDSAGNFYIADTDNHLIRKISPNKP